MHIRIYIEYQAYLQDHTVMDFDEMLFQYNNEMLLNDEFLEMESSQYKYVMVDECQDMNPIQMLIVELIITKHRNAMYVGDTDQAIYGWRGSDSNLIMNLVRKKKMKVFTLPDNFRSDGTIVFAAERLISHNQNRMDKCMVPVKPMVNPIIKDTYIDKKSEAIGIASKIEKHHKEGMPYKDMMVLYRNNIDSTMIEMILEEKGIPYEIDGTSLISRKEIALCISYYSFLWNTKDDMAFLEILNNPARGIGPARLNDITNASSAHHCSMYEACKYVKDSHITKFVEMIESLLILKDSLSIPDFFDYMVKHTGIYQAMERESQSYRRFMRMNAFKEALVSYMESNDSIMDFINNFKLSNLKEETNEDRVRLLTIHQAKGLEAKVVFIAGCNLETMPGNKTSLKEIEEERNLMYVAVTRAMDYLYITVPLKNLQNQPLHPSPFIKELLTLPKIKVEDDPELPF